MRYLIILGLLFCVFTLSVVAGQQKPSPTTPIIVRVNTSKFRQRQVDLVHTKILRPFVPFQAYLKGLPKDVEVLLRTKQYKWLPASCPQSGGTSCTVTVEGNMFSLKPASPTFLGDIEIPFILTRDTGAAINGKIILNVASRPPLAFDLKYQSINGEKRSVHLSVRDVDEMYTHKKEIKEVKIVKISENPTCTLQHNGEVLKDGSVVTQPYEIIMTPSENFASSPEGCFFTYQATDLEGLKSKIAKVRLIHAVAKKPVAHAYSMNVPLDTLDPHTSIQLFGTMQMTGTIQYIIAELPKYGELYKVNDTSSELLPQNKLTTKGVTVYSGVARRYMLIYKAPNAEQRKAMSFPTTDVVTYFVKDQLGQSAPVDIRLVLTLKSSALHCGTTIVNPFFAGQPQIGIELNYSDPGGSRINKLRLISTPQPSVAFGDLYMRSFGNHSNLQLLKIGSYFTDRDQRLIFVARQNAFNLQVSTNIFGFRAVSPSGESCIGNVVIHLKSHNANSTPVQPVRLEAAYTNAYTLLPLAGEAMNTLSLIQRAEFQTVPTIGDLYTLSPDAPFQPTSGFYRTWKASRANNVVAKAYCNRVNCEKYRGGKISSQAGSNLVEPHQYAQKGTLELSTPKMFVLFKAPTTYEALPSKTTTFSFQFVGPNETHSPTQTVVINLLKGKKRRIEIMYNAKPWTNWAKQSVTKVVCTLSNKSNDDVMILKRRKGVHHFERTGFKLYQYRADGNESLFGSEVKNSERHGQTGMWVTNENKVILVPDANSRSHVHKFSARIYENGKTNWDNTNFEDLKFIVRRTNQLPKWEHLNTTVSVEATGRAQMFLVANDEDGDSLSFILTKAPKKGNLHAAILLFGNSNLKPWYAGSRISVPRGSQIRNVLPVWYQPTPKLDWVFPQVDTFSVVASDGSGSFSTPIRYTVIINKGKFIATPEKRSAIRQSVQAGFAVVVSVFLLVAVTIYAVRKRNKTKYMQLPDTEMVRRH